MSNKASKIPRAASGRPAAGDREQSQKAAIQACRVVVFSPNDSLPALVKATAREPWQIVWSQDALEGQTNLARPNVRIVIVDDATVSANDRGWFVTRIRRDLPFASIIYIASRHSEATERTARASGAHYYTAGPLDCVHFEQVLRGFLRVAE